MRKMLGFGGSHLLYFLADCVDAVMHKTGSRLLFPLYSKLLVRSADVENWGGGGGAWGCHVGGTEMDWNGTSPLEAARRWHG
jgi:hypothetical protein